MSYVMSNAAGCNTALDAYADQPIWVCWHNEEQRGKPTKVPYAPSDHPTGLKASSTDPSTWATRAIAEHAAARDNRDGIGVVLVPLSEGCHLGGIDLDACIDDEGDVDPWAREIIERVDSYTEISPSGLGLKIFFDHDQHETLADGVHWRSAVRQPSLNGGKDRGIEFYLRARYFTVTDNVFENYATRRHVDIEVLRDVQSLMEAFGDKPKASTRHPRHHDDDQERLFDALSAIPGEDTYAEWVRIGMALHAEEQGSDKAYRAFVAWSAKGSKFDEGHCEQKWREWNKNPARNLTGGTIIYLARRNGWQDPRQAKTNGKAAKTPDPNGTGDKAAAGRATDQPGDAAKERGPKQADLLIALVDKAKLFHTPDGTGFADLDVNGHRETWQIQQKGFRRWLAKRFFETTGSAANSEALQSALNVIDAKADFDGEEHEVHIRVGGLGGKLYLDLCDDKWRAVEIDKDGWEVIEKPPLRFRRAAGMQQLPTPQQGGSITRLRCYLNVASDSDFVLVVSWVLACLRNRGPYPVLVLMGEQGSAKSTFAAILRKLIDACKALLRSLPRDKHELAISAGNIHLLVFDNVSSLPQELSDALCRLATGGGLAARRLYTDQDEVLFDACRPIILNGIENFVSRPDLADRAIFLTLKPIPEENRRPEGELWSKFEAERPHILGALLDAMVVGLKRLPDTHLPKLPRMADFAVWATACETALWSAGTFMKAYDENIEGSVEAVIDADPVADTVRTMMTTQAKWEGTAKDLLSALAGLAGERITMNKSWPATSEALRGRLRRAATGLRKIGIEIVFPDKNARPRNICITSSIPARPRPEDEGAQLSELSKPSAAKPKSNDDKDLAEAKGPTVIRQSDSCRKEGAPTVGPTVGANSLKSNAPDSPDSFRRWFPYSFWSGAENPDMTPQEALAAAHAAGVEVELDAGDLVVSAAGELPDDILDLLRTNKADVVEFLQAQASPTPSAPPPSPPAPARPWSAADWRLFHNDRQLVAELALGKTRGQARTYAYACCIREWCRTRPGASEAEAVTALVEKGIIDPSPPPTPPAPATRWSTADWQTHFNEKAAISEHDHGMSRQEAEKHAFEHCIAEWLDRNPAASKVDDGCRVCGDGDRPGDDLLPVGIGTGLERVWLHSNCIPTWHSVRIDAAVEALRVMGITGGQPDP